MTAYVSCADTAKLVRAALKAAFPACTFAVRSKVYSLGASINVTWTDGPTTARVEVVAHQFCKLGADHIFCRREMSDKHWTTVAASVANFFGVAAPSRKESVTCRVDHVGEYFSDLVYRAAQDRTRYAFSSWEG